MNKIILSSLRANLLDSIKDLLRNSCTQSTAFVQRILWKDYASELSGYDAPRALSASSVYEGYPQVARLGFLLGRSVSLPEDLTQEFVSGIKRLRARSGHGLETLIGDDVAILGIADGLTTLVKTPGVSSETLMSIQDTKDWFVENVAVTSRNNLWTSRMRDLAADLLDNKGRLRTSITTCDLGARSLELALRESWPVPYADVPFPDEATSKALYAELLRNIPEHVAEVEKAAVFLKTVDLLTYDVTEQVFGKPNKKALEALTLIKNKLDQRAQTSARRSLFCSFLFLFLMAVLISFLIYHFGWDKMQAWVYLISLAGILVCYGYYAITLRQLSPMEFYERLVQSKTIKLYHLFGFDHDQFEELCREAGVHPPEALAKRVSGFGLSDLSPKK